MSSPLGKWPENLGNVVYFENQYFLKRLREHIVFELDLMRERVSGQITGAANSTVFRQLVEQTIISQVSDPIINGFDDLKLSEQALSMNAVIKDKPKVYSSFNQFEGNLIVISNKMMAALEDSSKYSMTSPIMAGFRVLGFLSLLLDNMIYAILIVLAILSYILISSLMVFNIDEKTYEFGMLRALGYRRKNLI